MLDFESKVISREVSELLWDMEKTVGTAESCTGGRIAEAIMSVPGASKYFKGGIISILDDATILYRQHTSNTLGAEQASKGFFARAVARAGQKQFFQVAKLLHKDFGLSYLRFLLYKILYSWF